MKAALLLLFTLCLISASAQDGTIDNSYGTNGKAYSNFTDYVVPDRYPLAIQADGKVIQAAYFLNSTTQSSSVGVTRFNMNGTPDNTFGSNGIYSNAIDMAPYAIAIQPDGKIVVAGGINNAASVDFAIIRLNTNGTPDNSFGTAGKVETDFAGQDDAIMAISIQADGKIVVAGFADISGESRMALARYNTNGSPDATFGTGGKVTLFPGGDSGAFAMLIQTDGKILTGGLVELGGAYVFGLARLNPNGSPDASFGTNGTVISTIYPFGFITAIAIQPDGKIVATGFVFNASWAMEFGTVRFMPNGSVDTGFGTNGAVSTTFGADSDVSYSIAVQTDGKIVVAGETLNSNGDYDLALVRYTASGAPDASFGTGGKRIIDIGNGSDDEYGVIASQGNKIIIAGVTDAVSGSQLTTVRLNNSAGFYTPPQGGTSINNPDLDIKIVVAPNPVVNDLFIHYSGTGTTLTVAVFDMSGKLMASGNFTSSYMINTGRFAPGTYLVNITDQKTGRQVQRMVVKQ